MKQRKGRNEGKARVATCRLDGGRKEKKVNLSASFTVELREEKEGGKRRKRPAIYLAMNRREKRSGIISISFLLIHS